MGAAGCRVPGVGCACGVLRTGPAGRGPGRRVVDVRGPVGGRPWPGRGGGRPGNRRAVARGSLAPPLTDACVVAPARVQMYMSESESDSSGEFEDLAPVQALQIVGRRRSRQRRAVPVQGVPRARAPGPPG